MNVPDANSKRFAWTITYNRADGTEQVNGPVSSSTPRVIVPNLPRSVPAPAGPISGG